MYPKRFTQGMTKKRQQRIYLPALISVSVVLVVLLITGPGLTLAQGPADELTGLAAFGSAFTYQGYLTQNGTPLDGVDQCDMIFSLWTYSKPATQLGSSQSVLDVDFDDGYFTVELNDSDQFGSVAFNGDLRRLRIEVRCPAGKGDYTNLGAQTLTAVPYAQLSHTTTALQGREILATTPQQGQVLKYNGSQWGPGPVYKRTVVVSPAGNDLANGTALRNALTGITDASAGNPYLLKIEPGVYDLGTTGLTMKQYVDIEGSGEGVTTITSAASTSSNDSSSATLTGANNAELRFLTVENTGGSIYAFGIYNNGAAPRLTHVTATASGGSYNFGVYNNNSASPTMNHVSATASGGTETYGVANGSSSPTMNNVTVTASGGARNRGVYNSSSSPTMNNVTVTASGGSWSYGVYNNNSSSTIHHSVISGTTNSIYNSSSYSTAKVAASQLLGPVNGTGTFKCVGVYTSTFNAFLDANCQ